MEAFAAHGDRVAMVSGRQQITYSQCLEQIAHLAANFRTSGLRAGDRVGLAMVDNIEVVLSIVPSAGVRNSFGTSFRASGAAGLRLQDRRNRAARVTETHAALLGYQRAGGAYIRPPAFHSALMPRAIFNWLD
ncbi:AMP-binding protein [Mesorhizobium cantuariense]|uniref:AMP-binding protein n=1 Tax=Mesorhizobium cantuariense TaxID=1300275 RepID=A0ABV7MV10_9HYPH